MTTTTNAPRKPAPTSLRRTTGGKLPAYVDRTGRFTVTRNPSAPGVPFDDSGYDIVDTRPRGHHLGHTGDRARVYDLDDARGAIDMVLRREYLTALQRFVDSERARMGLPTIAEDAAARSHRARTSVTT